VFSVSAFVQWLSGNVMKRTLLSLSAEKETRISRLAYKQADKNDIQISAFCIVFFQWAEAQQQCNRLKLIDLIVTPWQRLMKYKLLLYAMRRPLDKMEPSSEVEDQKRDINEMVSFLHMPMFLSTVTMPSCH
jgi:hypothetical protein